MIKFMYVFILVAIVAAVTGVFLAKKVTAPADTINTDNNTVICTADAMQCPDGSYVGRTGPKCEFVCPEITKSSSTDLVTVDKNNPIRLDNVTEMSVIKSPLEITGTATGGWYFEGSFGVSLLDSSDVVISSAPAVATSNWMTPDPVKFKATMNFVLSSTSQKMGKLIFTKDNPSGLPENDASYEVPVLFTP